MSRGRWISPEMREEIVAMYKTGLTYREVADRFGISDYSVGKYVRQSGYDRYHVGSKIAKSIPTAPALPASQEATKPAFTVQARSLKLHSDKTKINYTISTESNVIEIESDTVLMQIRVDMIDTFISELKNIKAMLGSPS